MKKLTIGMCVYDDYDGVFFSIQSLRMYHSEVMDQVEFIIVDNNPTSESGKAVKAFTESITQPVQYFQFTNYKSTSLKNKIFELADTPYVLCMDCHVLLAPGSLQKLIDFYDKKLDEGNLLQGPLLYDDFGKVSTHFNREWSGGMQGQWETIKNYQSNDSEPFEIPAQGMGLFSCRKESWLGFNKLFRGFGGEEVYIHDKFRSKGKKVICLPFMMWLHRFTRIQGPTYPNTWEDRYRNYIIGRIELGLDVKDVEEAFSEYLNEEIRTLIKVEVIDELVSHNACMLNSKPLVEDEYLKESKLEDKKYYNIELPRIITLREGDKEDLYQNTPHSDTHGEVVAEEVKNNNIKDESPSTKREVRKCGCRNSN